MPLFAYESPLGLLTILGEGDSVTALSFAREDTPIARKDTPIASGEPGNPLLERTARELDRYFSGDLAAFTVPLAPRGTAFQRDVWEALRAIPYGGTASYADIARAVGRPGAARAVGMACNRNPIAILIPCHRVVGASGDLTGYSGGLEAKRFLLALEARSRARGGMSAGRG